MFRKEKHCDPMSLSQLSKQIMTKAHNDAGLNFKYVSSGGVIDMPIAIGSNRAGGFDPIRVN
jgi:hypothetical protein